MSFLFFYGILISSEFYHNSKECFVFHELLQILISGIGRFLKTCQINIKIISNMLWKTHGEYLLTP